MKSETLLQYLGYFAVSIFCIYFVMVVLKVNSDFIYSSSFDHMGLGSPLIEGLEVSDAEKKLFEKAGEHVDIYLETLDKDVIKKRKEFIDTVPDDAKESLVDLYDNVNEATAINLLKQLLDTYKGTNAHPKKGTYFYIKFAEWLKKLREDHPPAIEKKVFALLGKKD